MYRTEKGHKEDVRHEVHEQAEVCGTKRSQKRFQRTADHAKSGTSILSKLLVSAAC